VVLASLPYALGPTTVIFGKHIDKQQEDRAKGIHTVPVVIGERAARYAALAMIALQYLLVIYLVITGFFTPVMLVTLIALTAVPGYGDVPAAQAGRATGRLPGRGLAAVFCGHGLPAQSPLRPVVHGRTAGRRDLARAAYRVR